MESIQPPEGPSAPEAGTALDRLARHWVYGGVLAGALLLVLMPVFLVGFPLPFVAVVLQLPLYMLHQYEEHDGDRFRAFVNREIGGGRDVLPVRAVFVINVVGVWVVFAAAIWLAALLGVGYGLIAIYGVLVNALVHVGAGAVLRRYNPGLATAVLLFLPVGVAALVLVSRTAGVGWGHHLLGVLVALALHGAIVAYARRRLRRAPPAEPRPAP